MERYFAINIGRQIGSGGHAVAQILSERMNINMYDKNLLRNVSIQSGISEECFQKADEESSRRSLRSILLSYLADGGMSKNYMSNEALFKIQSDVIRNIHQQESCIFIGRCADYILRDSSNIFNLFISASLESRIEAVAKSHNCTTDKALQIIDDADRKRAAYYNYYTGKKWGNSSSYHLCLDSSILGIEQTANIIEQVSTTLFGL